MKRFSLVLMSLLFFPLVSVADNYHTRPEVQAFIDEMVEEEGFSREELTELFAQAVYKQSIIDAISRPAERVLTWKEYQDIFLTDKRVRDGHAFLLANHEALIAARDEYGVPPVIVAAIIGVETMYGQIKGSFRVIDALSTLAFDYPPRSKFFRGELKHFLMLAREENQSPLQPVGSYAGAMGYGQFIPSSYRHYAIDFDGDGFRDIWDNRTDAIGSVANYLAEHGWQAEGPIAVEVMPEGESMDLFGGKLKPGVELSALADHGLASPDASGLVSPLRFEGKSGSEFWIGFRNFYVITRYNHSKLYAMAVYQLSERLLDPEVVTQR